MTPARQRNLIFDAVKLLAVFLMVWTHTLADFRTFDYLENPIFVGVYSFHMPLFMTIVGFFSESVADKGIARIIGVKARQLLLPAIAFYLPLGVGVLIKSGFPTMIQSYISSFWFLKSAFLCFLIYFTTKRIVRHQWLTFIISLPIGLYISDYSVCKMYPYFLLGIWLRTIYPSFRNKSGVISAVSGAVFLTSLIFFDAESLLASHRSPLQLAISQPNQAWIPVYILSLISATSGSIFIISLFEYIARKMIAGAIGKKIATLGSETLAVYLFQTVMIELPPKYVGYLDDMNDTFYTWILTPLVSVAVILLTHYICRYIKLSGWLSFFILGKPLPHPASRRLIAD